MPGSPTCTGGTWIITINSGISVYAIGTAAAAPDAGTQNKALTLVPSEGAMERESVALTCGTKRTCKQMATFAEATIYLQSCGVSSLDGNGDGIPCNGLCR